MKKVLLFILALMAFAGCSNKWKETADVNFRFEVEGIEEKDQGFWFLSGLIRLGKVTLEGDRLQARDISFEDAFTEDFEVRVASGNATTPLSYQLPQGTYKSLKMKVVMNSVAEDTLPAVELEGFYKDDNGQTSKIRFDLGVKVVSELETLFPEGQDDYPILAGDSRSAVITFRPDEWFSGLSPQSLASADRYVVAGEEVIWISATRNVDIYNLVLSRVGRFDEVQFE